MRVRVELSWSVHIDMPGDVAERPEALVALMADSLIALCVLHDGKAPAGLTFDQDNNAWNMWVSSERGAKAIAEHLETIFIGWEDLPRDRDDA